MAAECAFPQTSILLKRRLFLSTAAIPLLGCGRRATKPRPVPAGAVVLALGDSLTFGAGALPQESYPTVLARITGWNVINAGISGHTSAQALERTQGLLQEHKPELVLLSIGGNDLLRRMPEADARSNIRRICELCIAAGAQVLLVAVPRPSAAGAWAGSLSDHVMYAEIADQLKLPLHAGGWSEVLGNDKLRSDQIHANAQGYEAFATGLAATAVKAGLLQK